MTAGSEKANPAPHYQLDDKEHSNAHVEDVNGLELGDAKDQGDYSGATAKTDPVEIRLVRKLDMRIMPILWAMYFLNYVSIPLNLGTYFNQKAHEININKI